MIVVTDVWVDADGEAFVRVANASGWLSARQREVLREVADGHTNAEIGRRLFMAESTVRSCLSRLMRRLQARDRTHLVHLAWRAGLLR